MPKPTNMSVPAAAARLGLTRQRVLQLIEDKDLKAEKIGRQWIVKVSAVEAYRESKTSKARKAGKIRFDYELRFDAVEAFLQACTERGLDVAESASSALIEYVDRLESK